MGLPGHATPEGTDRYRRRFAAQVAEGHFRRSHGLRLSSVGLGTYLGDEDARTDEQYRRAVTRAVELGCNVLDSAINYIHNPETQLQEVPRDRFLQRLREAFATFEDAVARGMIRMYGTATWNGYRQPPSARDYLSLSELVALAREVGGPDHHFRVIQLPHNLGMPEALTRVNQQVDGEWVSTLEAASRLGLLAMASASILHGQMARDLPPLVGEALRGLTTDAQRAIQFVRSTPGLGVALVGMKQIAHVEENLATAGVPPARPEDLQRVFRRHG